MAKVNTPTYFKVSPGQYYTGPNQKVTDSNTVAGLEGGKIPFSTVQKGLEGQFIDSNFFSRGKTDANRKAISDSMYSPTIFTDSNIRETVIPSIIGKAKKLVGTDSKAPITDETGDTLAVWNSNMGAYRDINSGEKYSSNQDTQPQENEYDAQYKELADFLKPPKPEDDPYLQLIKQMQGKSDEATERLLTATTDEYTQLKEEMRQAQESSSSMMRGTLSRLGSRYSPFGAAQLMQSKMTNDLKQIATLTSKEAIDKNKILAAQSDKDFELMGKQIEVLESRRAEKAKIAEKMMTEIQAQRKKIQEQEIQSSRDAVVADLMMQGVRDPAEMLSLLNESGGDFTAKEIGDSIKLLTGAESAKQGSVDLQDYFALQENGLLPDFITSQPPQDQFGAYTQWRKGIETGKVTPQGTPTDNIKKVSPITDLTQIDDLPVSPITKAVMAGYGKLKDLTPTDKATVLSEMYAVGFNPQTYVMSKLNNLITAYAQIPENQRGVIEGFIKPWATYTEPKVSAFESAKEVLTREIARLNDVGMLSDQDVASYKKAMPSRMDNSLGIVLNKISGLSSTLTGKKSKDVGKVGVLKDGRQFIVSFDGETLLDPMTGEELE